MTLRLPSLKGEIYGAIALLLTLISDVLVLYYFDVTIVNRYGKDLTIVTTHPSAKYHRFMIRNGENYKIESTHSAIETIYITAYDGIFPIQIDGKSFVEVSSSLAQNNRVYKINSGELYKCNIIFNYLVIICYFVYYCRI